MHCGLYILMTKIRLFLCILICCKILKEKKQIINKINIHSLPGGVIRKKCVWLALGCWPYGWRPKVTVLVEFREERCESTKWRYCIEKSTSVLEMNAQHVGQGQWECSDSLHSIFSSIRHLHRTLLTNSLRRKSLCRAGGGGATQLSL